MPSPLRLQNGSPCASKGEPILDLRANVMVSDSRQIPAASTGVAVRRSASRRGADVHVSMGLPVIVQSHFPDLGSTPSRSTREPEFPWWRWAETLTPKESMVDVGSRHARWDHAVIGRGLSGGPVTVSTGWSERTGGSRQTTTGLTIGCGVRRFDPASVGDANNLGTVQVANSVNKNSQLQRVRSAPRGLNHREKAGSVIGSQSRYLSTESLGKVRCEGPTCTDHANALPYGINLWIHTMRNGRPSQFRFNGSPGVAHRIPSHNPMPLREVLAIPSLRTVSTQGRFQRARAAVNGVL
jgi:hypothetical protein